MSKKYIDVKVTVWNRYHLDDDTNVSAIIEDLKSGKSVDDALDNQNAFDSPAFEYQTLVETDEMLTPSENDGMATLEVYDEDANEHEPVYTNEVKRA